MRALVTGWAGPIGSHVVIGRKSKLPGESFSAVIRRSVKKGKLTEIAGRRTLTRSDWNAAKAKLEEQESLASAALAEK